MEELLKLLSEQMFKEAIDELKSKRYIKEPETDTVKNQLDPLKHEVFNRLKRPDKRVKIDPDDVNSNTINVTNENVQDGNRLEPVARIAFALQKRIVNSAKSFVFGNPVKLNATPTNENEKAVLFALNRVLYDNKQKSLNRRVAQNLFSCTEVAELWYPVETPNSVYGFDSKFKLKSIVLSPLLGDSLYPYFDDNGDMTAFSREFDVQVDGKTKSFFETYTADFHYMWVTGSNGYELVEGYPKPNAIKKIPVVFGNQDQPEWADVQGLIERLEKLLSNFADTNDYHASPKIFVQGGIKGFAKKGESGAILEGEEGATAQYLSWANAPESVKLEIDTLLRMIHSITQTPDTSFDMVKGIGSISGVALKLLFMDAHLKVQDHQEVLDEYLQRRINIIKAYIGEFNTKLKKDAENIMVEPVITPYMIEDKAADIKMWVDANGGNPVISQKASFQMAGLTSDSEADFEQFKTEQSEKSAFTFNEPTNV